MTGRIAASGAGIG